MLLGWGWKGAALGYALFCQTLEERDALSICAGCGYLKKNVFPLDDAKVSWLSVKAVLPLDACCTLETPVSSIDYHRCELESSC